MRSKKYTERQRVLVEDYLPSEVAKSKKLDDSMKLVLADIYKQHYIHPGLRTVFRTNMSFKADIEAKQSNELLRPLNRLIKEGYVTRTLASEGKACEYTLTDEYYAMLPECLRVSKVTKNASKDTTVTLEKKIEDMSLEINELREQINVLREQLSEVSKVLVSNSKVTTINNEHGCHKDILHKTHYSYMCYNQVNNHMDLSTPGPGDEKNDVVSSLLISEETSGPGIEDNRDYSHLEGTGITGDNIERFRYWEKRISEFENKIMPGPQECGIVPIDNSDVERIACWMKNQISEDGKLTPRAQETLYCRIDEALSCLLRAA